MTLHTEVHAFLKRSGMKPSRFGRKVLNDPSFVLRLKPDKDPLPATVAKVRRFIEAWEVVNG